MLGLQAQGRTAPAAGGASALQTVRNSGGGWGFLARSDQVTDANSTGVVMTALRATNGARDAQGTAALLALQVGCDGGADAGGIAFQDASTGLVPDALATAQATPALAGVVLPLAPTNSTDAPVMCAAPAAAEPTTTTTSTATSPTVSGEPLARTGSSTFGETGAAAVLLVGGIALVQAAQVRRRRHSARS